ncbi:MAG: DNA primase [Treponema sp.]|nr:DNA primase [Treponema sp.]
MAGRISQDTIERIRQSADIVSIISNYTNLTQKGAQYWGCCPFHNEKTPSFTVDPIKKFYHCFGCGVGGDAVKFIMEMEKLSYPEALQELAKRHNIEITYEGGSFVPQKKDDDLDTIREVYNRITSTFHYFLTQTPQGKSALEYIKGRGLTDETLAKFKLGYAPADRFWLKKFLKEKNYSDAFLEKTGLFSKKYPDLCIFAGRLIFPIFDRKGEAVAFGGRILGDGEPKYQNSPELAHYHKRETLYAFNFAKNAIHQQKTAILCEGYMDVIAYHQCGVNIAVAPLGTSLTEQQLKILQGFCDTILLSFDSDGAGQKATKRAILMCRQFNLTTKIIRLEGGKDPAEIMIKFGAETLTKQVQNAILDSDFLLSKIKAQYPSESPEDKTKAALAFFPYVDSLQSDIQKESSLDQLARAFNLKPEAVRKDFNNRSQARSRLESRSKEPEGAKKQAVKLNAEVRAVLAVLSNPEEYVKMRAELTSDDFEDPLAKDLFIKMEERYKQGNLSFMSVIEQCGEDVQRLVTAVTASGEFSKKESQSEADWTEIIDRVVLDSIRLIKRNALERQRKKLNERLRDFTPTTSDDKNYLDTLVSEISQLDIKIQRQKM